jgi:hypothetical protein
MAYLFAKDNIAQSLRLGFAGAWVYAYPELADPLQLIRQHCPHLIDSFLPLSECDHNIKDDNDSYNNDQVGDNDEGLQLAKCDCYGPSMGPSRPLHVTSVTVCHGSSHVCSSCCCSPQL